MDKLNRIINLDNNEKIEDLDLLDIIDYYTMIDNSLKNAEDYMASNPSVKLYKDKYNQCLKAKAIYLRTIVEALDNKILDADTFLSVAISKCECFEHLILIALAIRFGANPNLYVVMKGKGIVHISIYTVMYLRGKIPNELIELILCLMGILGSTSSSRALKPQNNFGNTYNENFVNNSVDYDEITVAEWLNSQGFNPMNDIDRFFEGLEVETQIELGTMADNPELAYPMGKGEIITDIYDENGILESEYKDFVLPGPNLVQLVLYNAYKCSKDASIAKSYSAGELKEIKFVIETGAMEVFNVLIDRGFNFSYFSMNRLLVNLKNTVEIADDGSSVFSNKILNILYLEMLKYVINKGVKLDTEQFNLLNNFSIEYAKQIAEIYSKPMWVKACSGSVNVPLPEMVKALAFSLNIDASNSKQEVCSSLNNISRVNPSELKKAATVRQNNRIASESLSPSDFASGKREIFCKNVTNASENPLRFADASLAVYTDTSKNTWCFAVSDFNNLIETPFNPITNEKLPDTFVMHMRNSIDMFKRAGVTPRRIIPFDTAVDKLNEKDKITNSNTDFIIETVLRLGQTRGLYEQVFRNLNVSMMHYTLDNIKMDQDYLDLLSQSHRFATFCKAVYLYVKMNPDNIDMVFETLKS